MKRIILVEDEPLARSAFRELIAPLADCVFVGEAANFEQAKRLLSEALYDVAFIDIHLIGGNGLDLVPYVRAEARFIFLTAYEEYAIRAFEINALDYLLKPVREERLYSALTRFVASPISPAGAAFTMADRILLKTDNRTSKFVRLKSIACIRSCGNYSEVYFAEGNRMVVRKSMKEWEDLLPVDDFSRIHRGTIVNVGSVSHLERASISTTLVYLEGWNEPIAASYRFLGKLRSKLATKPD